MLWPSALPPGSYALAVLAWYGVGRFFLEPLRERPDIMFGQVRINQVVAALLALAAGGALLIRGWAD
jgi:phosphatidylglycerol:prolipoprotein diacylglycerol transferase